MRKKESRSLKIEDVKVDDDIKKERIRERRGKRRNEEWNRRVQKKMEKKRIGEILSRNNWNCIRERQKRKEEIKQNVKKITNRKEKAKKKKRSRRNKGKKASLGKEGRKKERK